MDSILEAYQTSVLKEGVLADLAADALKALREKGVEVTEKRAAMVKDLFSEFEMAKKDMGELMKGFMSLVASDAAVAEKAMAIRAKVRSEVLDKMEASQRNDVESLTGYVAELYADSGNKNAREKAKEKLAKVLAFIEDADLAKIVKAEQALMKLVARNA